MWKLVCVPLSLFLDNTTQKKWKNNNFIVDIQWNGSLLSSYLTLDVPWIPSSLDGKIQMAEGESSCSYRHHRICVPTAIAAEQLKLIKNTGFSYLRLLD